MTVWHRVRPLCWLLFALFGLLYGATFALFGVRSLRSWRCRSGCSR
ncbi:hypothetical protein AB5I41_17640 [Sphingomonas sp. MMS24-JH45]